MKISVRVKPNAREERVEQTGDNEFLVRVKAKPVEGEANYAVVRALAGYFGVSKSRVVLVRGQTSKQKIFSIEKP
jgi:uncharacterized protein (TIGR00251 family)